MLGEVDYALFAANAYAATGRGPSSVVSNNNEIPIKVGWTTIVNGVNNTSGFLARAYKNDVTGDIVIAYAGTTFEDGMKSLDWTNGNLPGASGLALGEQVVDAAKFYLGILCISQPIRPSAR